MLAGEERISQLVQLPVGEQPAGLDRCDQLGGDPTPPPAVAQKQRHQRQRHPPGAAHLGQQLQRLHVSGAAPPARRRLQQPPAQLVGIPDARKLLELLVVIPAHEPAA